ncbi:phosphate permease, partial [mine drainage metagenome]
MIVATALSWFLLDVSFYSTSIFNPLILKQIGFAASAGANALAEVRILALGNILIALVAAVPGYWVAVALINRVGRRPLQMIGFTVMAVSFFLLSVAYA